MCFGDSLDKVDALNKGAFTESFEEATELLWGGGGGELFFFVGEALTASTGVMGRLVCMREGISDLKLHRILCLT